MLLEYAAIAAFIIVTAAIGFIAIGLGMLFLELFIPSAGILGVVGSLCTLYGIWEIIQGNVWAGVAVIVAPRMRRAAQGSSFIGFSA